jgi:hypothetical protein
MRKLNTITVIIFNSHTKGTEPFKTSGNCVYHQFEHSKFVHYAHKVHYIFIGLSELKVDFPNSINQLVSKNSSLLGYNIVSIGKQSLAASKTSETTYQSKWCDI